MDDAPPSIRELLTELSEQVDSIPDHIYKAGTLTKNGSNSLITTIPNEFWRDAGIEHESPGSIGMYYLPEENVVVMDLGR